jgi:hypothetical protein
MPFFKPPRLFDFGHFSYLQVIKTPPLLDISEYTTDFLKDPC